MEVQKDPESGRYRYRPTGNSAVEDDSDEEPDSGPSRRRKHLDDGANQVMAEIFEQRKMAVVAKRGGKSIEERADSLAASLGEPSVAVEIPDHLEVSRRPALTW